MSEIIRRAAFYDLGSKFSSLIDVWPKRDYHLSDKKKERGLIPVNPRSHFLGATHSSLRCLVERAYVSTDRGGRSHPGQRWHAYAYSHDRTCIVTMETCCARLVGSKEDPICRAVIEMQKSQESVTIRGVRQSHLYVVAYDIPNDQRRTKVHKILKGFGKWTEFSLFECFLTKKELLQMHAK